MRSIYLDRDDLNAFSQRAAVRAESPDDPLEVERVTTRALQTLGEISIDENGVVCGLTQFCWPAQIREAIEALDYYDADLVAQIRAEILKEVSDPVQVELLTARVLAGVQLQAQGRARPSESEVSRLLDRAQTTAEQAPPRGAPIVSFDRREDVAVVVKQHAAKNGAEATLELLAELMAEYEPQE